MEPTKASVASGSLTIVKAVVVNDDGSVLVLRRSPDDSDSPGRLDFPGGGIESGESYSEAVAREIGEEAGIAVSVDDLKLAYTFTRYDESSDTTKIRLLYMAYVDNPAVKLSHEHDAYWWRTPDELVALFAEISWGEAVKYLCAHDLMR